MDLTLPIFILGAPFADWSGTAELTLSLASGTQGLPFWLQGFSTATMSFTNSLALVVE